MKDEKGHGSDPRGAHAEGVDKVGKLLTWSGVTGPLDPTHQHFDVYVDHGYGTRRMGNNPYTTIGAKSLSEARAAWKQIGSPSQTAGFRLERRK